MPGSTIPGAMNCSTEHHGAIPVHMRFPAPSAEAFRRHAENAVMDSAVGPPPTRPGPEAAGKSDIAGIVAIPATSITSEGKRALVASDAQWRAVFEKAPVAAFEMDLEGRITRANRRMAGLLDCAVSQLVGTNVARHVHPDELAPSGGWAAGASSGETLGEGIALHLVTSTGADRWVLASGAPVGGGDGDPDQVLVYAVDATARHLERRRHARTTDRFAALVEHSADAIVVQDAPGGNVVYASPGLSAITGTTPAAVIGSA